MATALWEETSTNVSLSSSALKVNGEQQRPTGSGGSFAQTESLQLCNIISAQVCKIHSFIHLAQCKR